MAKTGEKRTRRRTWRSFRSRMTAGSFLLSRTERLSARVEHSLRKGFFSRLLGNFSAAEHALRSGLPAGLLRRMGVAEHVCAPIRETVAAGAHESGIMAFGERLRRAFFQTRTRFFGIAGLVFSLYAVGSFLVSHFTSAGAGGVSPMALCTAAVTFLISVLLLFCGQPLGKMLFGSRFFNRVLVGMLGAPTEAFRCSGDPQSASARGGLAFIAGTATGLLTFVLPPHRVLLLLPAALFLLCIPATPEMGLLAAVILLPVAPFSVVRLLAGITMFGYLQKYLRYKRVFRFRISELAMLLTVGVLWLSGLSTGDTTVFSHMLLYGMLWFLIVNLMTTERLYRKLAAALLYGGLLTLLIVGAGLLIGKFPNGEALAESCLQLLPRPWAEMLPEVAQIALRLLSGAVCSIARGVKAVAEALSLQGSQEVLGCYLLLLTPIALLHGKRRSGLLLSLLILLNAALLGSRLVWIGILFAILLYAALANGAWTGAALFGTAGAGALLLSGVRAGNAVAGFSATAGELARRHLLSGLGSGDGVLLTAAKTIGLAPDGFVTGLYTRLILEGGLLPVLLVIAAALLALQRLYGAMRSEEERTSRRLCGSIAAACLLFLLAGLVTDVWADFRIFGVFWCLCPAASLAGELFGEPAAQQQTER